MKIILARHAAANDGSKGDSEKILADEGQTASTLMGKIIAATLGRPGAVWSSSLPRAVETGRLAMEAMGATGSPEVVEDLGPEGDVLRLALRVQRSKVDLLMLVGHQPNLGSFAARLLGLESGIHLRKGGFTVIETPDALRGEGRALATLSPEDYQDILDGKQYVPWTRTRLRI